MAENKYRRERDDNRIRVKKRREKGGENENKI
jgi:hypothetical protein